MLAKIAGVSDNTWGTWERGGRNMGAHWVVYRPRPESLVGIARALDIPAKDVFAEAKMPLDDEVVIDLASAQEFDADRIDRLIELVNELALKIARLPMTVGRAEG